MSATIIVVGRFAAGYEAYFAEYSARVRAFLQSKGAVTVRRQRIEQTLYGGDPADLVMAGTRRRKSPKLCTASASSQSMVRQISTPARRPS